MGNLVNALSDYREAAELEANIRVDLIDLLISSEKSEEALHGE